MGNDSSILNEALLGMRSVVLDLILFNLFNYDEQIVELFR